MGDVRSRVNLIETPRGRRVLFTVLYFGEGAPIGFIWWALPTLLRERGVGLDEIGSLSALLVLPWALKFLWAPLIDIARGPFFTLRGWITASQGLMVVTLAALAVAGPGASMSGLRVILLLHAFAAATQDVAVDALAIRSTDESERGGINAWMQAGMLSGRALFGGGALLLVSVAGERAAVALLAAAVAATASIALAYRDLSSAQPRAAPGAGFAAHLAAAFGRRSTWLALGFAAVGAAGFEAAGVLVGPMLTDVGVSTRSIGAFLSFPAAGLMLLGGLAGGRLCRVVGTVSTVAASGAMVAVVVTILWPVAAGVDATATWTTLSALYLLIGAFTVASYAFFMDRTDRDLGSTQFSAYMGATNLCEAWAGRVGGAVAASRGYGVAFGLMAAVSLAAIPLVFWAGLSSHKESR